MTAGFSTDGSLISVSTVPHRGVTAIAFSSITTALKSQSESFGPIKFRLCILGLSIDLVLSNDLVLSKAGLVAVGRD